jgi:hypothetical protein
VFYGHRLKDGKLQAVLATVALDGYSELNPILEDQSVAAPVRQAILHGTADVVWSMHRHHLKHGSLTGKHVMVKLEEDDAFDLRIIDLEQMRRSWRPLDTSARDLEKFIRHTPTLTPDEHAQFVSHYAQYLSPELGRKLAEMINRRIVAKWPTSTLSVPA